jgi:hypothetical protein
MRSERNSSYDSPLDRTLKGLRETWFGPRLRYYETRFFSTAAVENAGGKRAITFPFLAPRAETAAHQIRHPHGQTITSVRGKCNVKEIDVEIGSRPQ